MGRDYDTGEKRRQTPGRSGAEKENEKTQKRIQEHQKREARKKRRKKRPRKKGKTKKVTIRNRNFPAACQFVNPPGTLQGQDVLVFDFEPNPEFKPHKLAEKVVQKLAGWSGLMKRLTTWRGWRLISRVT